jgi:hypothetical protein
MNEELRCPPRNLLHFTANYVGTEKRIAAGGTPLLSHVETIGELSIQPILTHQHLSWWPLDEQAERCHMFNQRRRLMSPSRATSRQAKTKLRGGSLWRLRHVGYGLA